MSPALLVEDRARGVLLFSHRAGEGMDGEKTYRRPHSIRVSLRNSPLLTRQSSPAVMLRYERPVNGYGNKLYSQLRACKSMRAHTQHLDQREEVLLAAWACEALLSAHRHCQSTDRGGPSAGPHFSADSCAEFDHYLWALCWRRIAC